MDYSFLSLQFSPPSMYPRGSIYSTPNRQWMVESDCSQCIWKAKSQSIWNSMRKTTKKFGFMHISRCTRVLAQNQCIHASIALKVVYRHKQVFFGNNLGTSKYNMGKGGPRILQRDMGGHKYVINQVW